MKDPGLAYEPENVKLLVALKNEDPANYVRIMNAWKNKVGTTELKKIIDRSDGCGCSGACESEEKINPAKMVVDAILEKKYELWHTPDRVNYITVKGLHLMVRSSDFKAYITTTYNDETGEVLPLAAINSVVETIDGYASHGEQHEINTRIARVGVAIYLDMANGGEVIEITKEGWRVRDGAPVRFRRPTGMLPLPYPESGGKLEDIRKAINVDDDQWILVKGWLIGTLNPLGSYAILVLTGGPGRLKSMTAARLKKLVDPANISLESMPTKDDALIIACWDNGVVAFDNVFYISDDLSDQLCKISSGIGFRARTLYTNRESTQTVIRRPMILNGLRNFVVKGDLVDRSIQIEPPVLPDWKETADADAAFDAQCPKLLGALLDYAVAGLNAKKPKGFIKTRMSDFAAWVMKCLGEEDGKKFGEAYADNKGAMLQSTSDGDLLLDCLVQFMSNRLQWIGTSSELLGLLNFKAGIQTKPPWWPKNGNKLGSSLNTIDLAIQEKGLIIKKVRSKTERKLEINHIVPQNLEPTPLNTIQAKLTENVAARVVTASSC